MPRSPLLFGWAHAPTRRTAHAPSGPPAHAPVAWIVIALLRRPAAVLARRAFRDARARTIAFGCLFAIYAYIQPVGYRHAYPTLSDQLAFAHSFAGNDALRLFYGYPYSPLTVGGYSAWRVGGTLAIVAAVFGLLAIAALTYAIVPRASAGIAYGLVTVTFLWQLSGSLLGAPNWLVNLTPFAHIGLVPAQPFRAAAAVIMLGIAVSSALAAMWIFQRRDLIGQ
jgi:putative exporter of polyketide antibiotics